jgi:protein-S-isoprenylcysteine O-methyltransferase Ste14
MDIELSSERTGIKQPTIFEHIRDIVILPFTVTVIIPYLCYNKNRVLFPDNVFLKAIGLVLLIAGLALFIRTFELFRAIGKGTLAPWTPTQKLIIRGPYKYCRNPMITGVFFILLGETMVLNSVSILVIACIFFLVNTIYFIVKEEPDLYKRFGHEYECYKKNVPRWLPRFRPYNQAEIETGGARK